MSNYDNWSAAEMERTIERQNDVIKRLNHHMEELLLQNAALRDRVESLVQQIYELEDEIAERGPRFSHVCSIAFTVKSNRRDGTDITPEMFQEALGERVNDVDHNNEWHEACLPPHDTEEIY